MNSGSDVLIVEDDEDMVEMIVLLLDGAGYPTRVALNGRQALDEVARAMPGLILLDMLMPVMDGSQFTHEFRARYGREVPIVVVTAAEHARARCASLDVSEVLGKPFDIQVLLQIVARHLGRTPARVASDQHPKMG